MSHQSIYAIAKSEGQALEIEMNLTQAGFSNDDISALIPDKISDHRDERAGGVLDAALDLLASMGALAIPGVGRLIAVGPLLSTLSAVAAGAAAVGLGGALMVVGVPERAAKQYEDRIAGGDILISVNAATAEQVERAKEVLEFAQAEDIAVTSDVAGYS